jgi:type II secretory pathway pseudopilin PulG
MTRFKFILTAIIVAAAILTSLLVQHQNQAKLHENDVLWGQQENQLAELAAENRRLSHLVAQTKTASTAVGDETAELSKLRVTAETLRQQSDLSAKQLAETRRSAGVQMFASGDFNLSEHNKELTITFAGGPRATGKLNDARAITAALRKYAGEHQGEFPVNLDQIKAYLPKPSEADSPLTANAPLTGTNDFEIVYRGSQNDLTNIPLRKVALIRERQPWLTADGKWARVYGFADGAASPVESDDNFQSWEAQYIIPPPDARQ